MSHLFKHPARCLTLLAVLTCMSLPARAAVNVGDTPEISFQATDGTRVTSETLKGQLVVIDFWATWCGPCVAAMPEMVELNNKYAEQGVQLIGVSLDSNKRTLQRFVKNNDMTWPQAFDGKGWDNRMAKQWGVSSIPRVFIVSPEGEVLWSGHPGRMEKPFQKALREHPPTPPGEASADDDAPSMTELRTQAVEALQKARKTIGTGETEQLLTLIAEVPEEVLDDRRVLANARVLLAKLALAPETQAELDAMKQADPESAARFDALAKAVQDAAPVAEQDPARATVHPKLVEAKLAQAGKADEAKKYHRAYSLYAWLLDRVPDTEAGHTAAQRLAELEADPEKMAVIRVAEAEQNAKALLSLGKNYEAAGNTEEARATYQKILDEYEEAANCCGEAKAALVKLE